MYLEWYLYSILCFWIKFNAKLKLMTTATFHSAPNNKDAREQCGPRADVCGLLYGPRTCFGRGNSAGAERASPDNENAYVKL